jgi:glycosyltransferase involved in cell wall biosynthesis
MSKVSFIIPARAERDGHVEKTLKSIYENATGDFEVIVGFDGGADFMFEPHQNLKIINFPSVVGIKTNINTLVACASGKYIFKLDAHCSIGKSANEILQADMRDNWIVMPRFYVLDSATWAWQDDRHYDYFYISCPFTDPRGFRFKAGGHWSQKTAEMEKDHRFDIDNTPQIHGSGWFCTKDRFFELGGFPLQDPMGHAQEPLWLGLRNWFAGGRVVVNKKTWYAHLHQETRDKGFALGHRNEERTYNLVADHFMRDPKMEWFLDRFMPMPTWTDDWRERLHKYQNE